MNTGSELERDLRLSLKRIQSAALVDKGDQFTFIVGNDEKEYKCCLFQACLVSEKVCNLVRNDPSILSLRVSSDEPCCVFDLIESLWNGESVKVTKDNVCDLLKLSQDLENEELYSLLIDFNLSSEPISVSNCISRLHMRSGLGMKCEEEISFIASHFFELSVSFSLMFF